MRRAQTAKTHPTHRSKEFLRQTPRTIKKTDLLARFTKETSVMKENLSTKNTGLVKRRTVAIRRSLRERPNSRNVPYRAPAPSQASTTVETRRAENESPSGKQNRAPQRICARG